MIWIHYYYQDSDTQFSEMYISSSNKWANGIHKFNCGRCQSIQYRKWEKNIKNVSGSNVNNDRYMSLFITIHHTSFDVFSTTLANPDMTTIDIHGLRRTAYGGMVINVDILKNRGLSEYIFISNDIGNRKRNKQNIQFSWI